MENEQNVTAIRNYKDTVFRMIFRDPEKLLSLYNAINKTCYTKAEELKIVTLENAVYLSMKNDVSCILDMRLQLYEQQTTYNPNMPLRCLFYLSKQYEKLVVGKDIYAPKLIKIPTPKFFVFYNGKDFQPERKELKLSEAFEVQGEDLALELKVIQLNVNEGFNQELKEDCPLLMEYMQYVDMVRNYQKDMELSKAVQKAVDQCIKNNILRTFLLANKSEVVSMTIFEYDEELHKKTLLEEGYEYGLGDGEMLAIISLVCKKLQKGKTIEEIVTELEEEELVKKVIDVIQGLEIPYNPKDVLQKLKKLDE